MTTRRRRFTAALLLVAGSALPAGQGTPSVGVQTPPSPTFKAEVEYVEVDAIVTDEQGRFVRGLQREDFQVFEDGKPQTIANFALVDVPVQRASTSPGGADGVEPDVGSTDVPFTGRMYVLILDSLHTEATRSQRVRSAARRFIDQHLSDNDLTAVVHTDGRTDVSQDFTANRRLLRAAVDGFMGQKLESSTLARNAEYFRGSLGDGRIADPLDTERAFNARSALRAIGQVSDWLAGVRGRRKTIVFISEGIDYDISDVFNNRSASSVIDQTRDAIEAATRADVSIYAIDPAIATGGADAEIGGFADQASSTSPANDGGTVERAPGINSRSLENERRMAQDSLRTLAEETSGFAAVTSGEFASAFERIVRDNSEYYVLAYYPTPAKRDGKFHRISVRTSQPGLRVRARRGYIAPRGNRPALRVAGNDGASPLVLQALNSPLPSSGVGMQVFAAPFRGAAPNASVVLAVELRGGDLAFAPDRVELSYAALDASGQVRAGDTDAFTLKLRPDMKTRVEQHGLRLLNRFDLPPGRYQIRVAARNTASGALGALSYDLEVPDFHKSAFSISGLLLTSNVGAATVTARPDEQLRAVMPAPPVALRAFPRQDELIAFVEIYERPGRAPHTVDISTTIRSADGAVRFQSSEERSSAEIQGSTPAYRHMQRLPMQTLEPGRYVLTVEARSRLGDTARRQIPFDVVR